MMKKMSTILFVVLFSFSMLFMLTSCQQNKVIQGTDNPPTDPTGTTTGTDPGSTDGPTAAEISEFEAGNIYFDYDRSELKATAKANLQAKATWLRANAGFTVKISGHCDARGTTEYNMALGERRANATWKYLNALGVSGNRMYTVSYGEEKPDDPGNNEAAWAKNRRAEFNLTR